MKKMNRCRYVGRDSHSGFSLIEVLVVMVIAAVALLGLGAMSVNALKYNQTAYLRSTAVGLAADMADRMRANLDGVIKGSYQRPSTTGAYDANKGSMPAAGCTTMPCTSDGLAQLDISNWYAIAATVLPSPAIQITELNPSSYQIVVGYLEPQRDTKGISDGWHSAA